MIAKHQAVMRAGSHANCKNGKNLIRLFALLSIEMILVLSSTCTQYTTQCSSGGSFPDTWFFLGISSQIDDSALMKLELSWRLTWLRKKRPLKRKPMIPGGRIKKLGQQLRQHARQRDLHHQCTCHPQNAVVANRTKFLCNYIPYE